MHHPTRTESSVLRELDGSSLSMAVNFIKQKLECYKNFFSQGNRI
jgi:hypothetical protein